MIIFIIFSAVHYINDTNRDPEHLSSRFSIPGPVLDDLETSRDSLSWLNRSRDAPEYPEHVLDDLEAI